MNIHKYGFNFPCLTYRQTMTRLKTLYKLSKYKNFIVVRKARLAIKPNGLGDYISTRRNGLVKPLHITEVHPIR